MKAFLVLLFLMPGTSLAQSPFDGTWIIDSDSAHLPEKPVVYLVAKGVFRCPDCGTKGIKTDGNDHEVKHSNYWDTKSVRIVDARTVEITSKKAGKTMFTETDTVSPDENMLTAVVKDTTEADTVTIETLSRRIHNGPSGSHAISGSWQTYKISRSKNGSIITYKCTTDGFGAHTPLGEGYEAKFDGKYYPVEDDPGHTMASVKLLDPNTVQVTSQRTGRIVGILRLSIAPGGKSIHAVFEDKESNTTRTFEMQKQP